MTIFRWRSEFSLLHGQPLPSVDQFPEGLRHHVALYARAAITPESLDQALRDLRYFFV